MESLARKIMEFSVALEGLGYTPSGRLRRRGRLLDERNAAQPKTPKVIYVTTHGRALIDWEPPEKRDQWRSAGYYWVSFWSNLKEVCHWNGAYWQSTGDERTWKSQGLDKVYETRLDPPDGEPYHYRRRPHLSRSRGYGPTQWALDYPKQEGFW